MFIVAHHYAPARLSASGYAEFHPVASNDSADGRSQNRRVDIIVLPSMTAPARAPAVVVRDLKPEAINAALARPLPAASR